MAEWIGIDLDGTLAHYDGWQGVDHIGEPILPMVNRVRQLLDDGVDVRIFTARVHDNQPKNKKEQAKHWIEKWCLEVFDRRLPITCEKDTSMKTCYDDRATQVVQNTGVPIEDLLNALLPHLPNGLYEKTLENLKTAGLTQRTKGIRQICSIKKEFPNVTTRQVE